MIAAVTLCAPILLIIMSIACVFGMGRSSVIARLLGEDKKEESGTTMNFCVYAMAIAGVAVLALGLVFLQPLAKISGADADNIAYTCDYLKWIFLGAPLIMMANGFVHLFRSVGLIKEGTIGLVLGNAINMVLDYVFVAVHRNLSVGNSGRRACHIIRICVCDGLLHVLHDWRGPQGQSASAMDPEAVFAEWGYDPQCSQYRHPRSSHHSAYECIQHCAEQLYPPLWV